MSADQLPGMREAEELERIDGVLERIVYESPDTGFFVGRLRDDKAGAEVTCVGNVMAVSPGETVRVWGRWVDDKRFGRQLRIERYETLLPNTVQGIEKYLGSGLIEGIGPVYAKRLVEAFGVETLRVIGEEPKRLRSVPGIGKKRAKQICEAWAAQQGQRSLMLFLQGHGISPSLAVKIQKHYGESTAAVLREDPYKLAQDIAGVAFKTADRIAANLGIEKDHPKRIEAGALYALEQAGSDGHVFLPETDLIAAARALLGVAPEHIAPALTALACTRQIVREDERIFLRNMYMAETECAQLLQGLLRTPGGGVTIAAERAIQWVERRHAIRLSDEQRQVLRTAAEAKAMVITGGPGTGKTTVINSLIAIFEKKGLAIELAAPTGRAAKRMEAATGHEARTIHRLLEFSPLDNRFTRDANRPLDADMVIIDEASMIDVYLMQNLLKAVPPHARLFLVGDVDQLPSVGPGNVLMDVISSNVLPVVWLKTVFRQAAESGIISNAHRINGGEFPAFNTEDFFFIERKDPAETAATVVEVVTNRIPKRFGLNPFEEVQVLAPMHRGEAGVANLNEVLQQALNADGEPIPGRNFRVRDKVMQLRNNYDLDVYNGDVGVVTLVDTEAKEVQVQFDDRAVLYPFDSLDELALAYAATVHKSQGSEYLAVVIPLVKQHYMMLQRNVLYTAITRGKRLVIIIGDRKAVGLAVRNTKVVQRNTRLAERLRGPGRRAPSGASA